MSRIGKLPIVIPDGVNIEYNNSEINIKGPKGNLNLKLRPEIKLEKKDNQLIVARINESKSVKSLHGLFRVLINNMVIGVTNGYQKKLEIVGTGYRANVQGKKLTLNLGYSYPYEFDIPEGINIVVDNNTNIFISGINKELVGETAAVIRKMRPPEPYKGKGIKYSTEIIKKKAGKSGK
ncbi:MAG: 50S ribosomal protein L6 [Spirochaetes bacterium]|nr:50S ribosomal protein L6 [Spirochaetota bacterium]